MSPDSTEPGAKSLRSRLNDFANRSRLATRDVVTTPFQELNDFQGGANSVGDKGLHESTSKSLTEAAGTVLPPEAAALVADVLGNANETVSGYGALAAGRPFEGKAGYDWADVSANREGQARALQQGAGLGAYAMAPGWLRAINTLAGAYRARH
jgi:hypothetical protein